MKIAVCSLFIALLGSVAAKPVTAQQQSDETQNQIQAKDYSNLIGMPGFSENMLSNHFKLYQGYVKNSNILLQKLNEFAQQAADKQPSPEYAELKRRLGWEFDSVLLHEYYFENLGGKEPLNENSALYKKINESFGSFDNWKKDFILTGMMRGIGWVVLYWEPSKEKLINEWINEHDTGHIPGAAPILIMDVFEHAYMPDYETEKSKYIDAFFKNINWEKVSQRYDKMQK